MHHAFKDEPTFDLDFNYRSVVSMLNYLARTTRPDIMYTVHQIAKYLSDPHQSHGEAILYLIRYLKKTRELGIHFKPDPKKGFKCYCDADFSGLWNKTFAPVDPSTSKSRSWWIIFYAGCPVSRASKLQSQVALSTTEAEHITMSQSLRDVIPIMGLLQEMRERNFNVLCTEPYVYCEIFEDNSGALELTRLPKLCPRTKHINICYHHFCKHVRKGLIKIFPLDTKDQIADTLTKPLAQNDFQHHRCFMCSKWPSQATKVRECCVWYFGTYFRVSCTVMPNHFFGSCLLEQNVLVWLHQKYFFKHENTIFILD